MKNSGKQLESFPIAITIQDILSYVTTMIYIYTCKVDIKSIYVSICVIKIRERNLSGYSLWLKLGKWMVHVIILDLVGEVKSEVYRGSDRRRRPNQLLTRVCGVSK